MTSDEIEKRLKAIEDTEEIKQLHYRYINCLNFARLDELMECFAENSTLDLGEGSEEGRIMKGKAAIAKAFDQMSAYHLAEEGYAVVHPIITVDGDTATGTWLSYFMHCLSRGEEPRLHWMQGVYDCKYVKENGKWKFSLLKWRSHLKYKQSQMYVVP
jgi:ketosteroid isomerase-like protein